MPETLDQPTKRTILTRKPARKTNWKLAAELRARGLTYDDIAKQANGSSGDAVRQGLTHRGVTQAIRTSIITTTSKESRETMAKLSEDTKTSLAKVVLEQSTNLEQTKVKPNLRNIKKIGDAALVLANGAKTIHGWGDTARRPMVQLNVLGSVRLEELPDTEQSSTVQADVRPVLPDAPKA